jgi:uncharacterized protein with HEPN domain
LSFRDAERHLRDILECIDNIESFLGDMAFDVYRGDLKTKSAVERQMQIITEAAVRLGEDGNRLCPGVDWKGFRAVWGTSCGTVIIELTTRLCGTP